MFMDLMSNQIEYPSVGDLVKLLLVDCGFMARPALPGSPFIIMDALDPNVAVKVIRLRKPTHLLGSSADADSHFQSCVPVGEVISQSTTELARFSCTGCAQPRRVSHETLSQEFHFFLFLVFLTLSITNLSSLKVFPFSVYRLVNVGLFACLGMCPRRFPVYAVSCSTVLRRYASESHNMQGP